MTVLRVDHIAVLVPKIDGALDFWHDALGLPMESAKEVPDQQAVVAIMQVGETDIELVQPTNEVSGLGRYLEKRGAGLHHVCLEVSDIDAVLRRLKDRGARLINEEPVIGANGKRVAFIHPSSASGVLVELVQSEAVL